MGKNIVEKANLDSPLLVYNRSPGRSHEFSTQFPSGKVEVIELIDTGISQADIIFTCLADDPAVKDVYEKMLQGDVKGKLFIESSTIHPETTEAVAKLVVDKGAEFVAAPVFGAPAMADAGQLVGVLAGPRASVERAKPFFKGVTSRAEIDLSDRPYGKATTLKVLGNTFIVNMVEQLSEAHVIAEKSGLGTDVLHQFIENMFPGPYAAYSNRMLSGDYWKRTEPLFAVDLALKDARHALKLAEASGAKLHNVETASGHLRDVKEHAGQTGDIAGIYGAARKEAGLKFENEA